jgi:dipeptidyl aminopeptidase/acylaminoacyl peptidase
MFKSAVALVPVTNLFQRLAYKGVERQHLAIDPANRYGGLPGDSAAINAVYKDRSPVYQVDKLRIPLLVHITKNDRDVNIEECMQLVDALMARKPQLAETKVYDDPKGGHLFDRQETSMGVPENTPEQVDSWNRVWAFFDRTLQPSK